MKVIDSLVNAVSSLLDFFGEIIDSIVSAFDGLIMFYNMLIEFDERIVAMIDNCGSNEFGGMPINKAIATFHYVVGDIIFYLIYLVVLFGCLWTVYKIVLIIYTYLKMYVSQLSNGVSSKGQMTNLLTGLFKK